MREMRFDHPEVLPGGRTVFQIKNAGKLDHRLILAPLPEDLPPLAEQVAGSQRRSIDSLAGIPDIPPGAGTSFAVDLSAGRYGLICFVIDTDGISHVARGMVSEFRVR